MKRETWRPQPTSSWAPAKSDTFRPSQGESSASGSRRYKSPPSGPSSQSRNQNSTFSRTDDDGSRRYHDRDDDIGGRSSNGWEDDRGFSRGQTENREQRERVQRSPIREHTNQPARGYGRDHHPDIREEDLKKGTFRTKSQIERDKKAFQPPTAPRDRGPRNGSQKDKPTERSWGKPEHRDDANAQYRPDRSVSSRTSDDGYRRGERSPRRDRSPMGRRLPLESDLRRLKDEPARGRRRSPDYGQPAERHRSSSRDSLYSPLPRRRSPSPILGGRSPSFPSERKRSPPSPRGGDSKRQRDLSPSTSVSPPRRGRSISRSRSRSRDRYMSRRSPSPPRRRRDSPASSPRREPRMRQWGRRGSPDRSSSSIRERSPIPPPRHRSPPPSPRSRSPIPPPRIRPPSSPTTAYGNNRGGPPPPRPPLDIPPGPPSTPRGSPHGGWGRSAGPLPEQNLANLRSGSNLHPSNGIGQAYTIRPPSQYSGPSAPASQGPPGRPYQQNAVRPPSGPSFQPPLGPAAAFRPTNPPFPGGSLPPYQPAYPLGPTTHGAYPPPQDYPSNGYSSGNAEDRRIPLNEQTKIDPVKIAFTGQASSPTKGGKSTFPAPSTTAALGFEDSRPPSPPPESPRRSLSRPASPETDRPPLQQPHVYMDLIAENEQKYTEHLRTVAPYIKAAFDQWFVQDTTPDLPDFLDHYFGRQPTMTEVTQIETLLGVRTRYSRDQEELKLLHSQAIDLRDRQSRVNGSDPASDASNVPLPRRRPWGHRVPEETSAAEDSEKENIEPAKTTAPEATALATVAPSPAMTSGSEGKSRSVARTKKTNASGEVYERLAHVGEGTYGKVYKARHVETGIFYALKRIRMEGEKDGFPVTAMREIKLLQNLRHPNVLRLVEMMVSKGSVYMVLEYMDHDLTGVLAQQDLKFSPANLKSLNYQMLSGLAYLHDQGILHRDMKGSNILLNASGELKLADFGLARVYSKRTRDDYTNRVITLWYRGPELLLGETVYGPEVDMWSAGCIMLELFCGKPVFQGNDEIHQLEVIYAVMGTPDETKWPGVKELPWYELVKPKEEIVSRFREMFTKWLSPAALDLAEGLLEYDTTKRLTAEQAMKTAYFTEEEPGMEMPKQLANCGEHHEMSAKLERHRRRQEGR